METEEFKALQKNARKKKRIATECASEVHDLVEDRLFSDYENLVGISQKTYEACLAWVEAERQLKAAEEASAT